MKPNMPPDELLQRYAQAKAVLPDGLPDQPSATLHERIMQSAREHANAINNIALRADSKPANGLKSLETRQSHQILNQAAANDSFWNIRALGSLAAMSLAGLLWWQFEHGTPEEREASRSVYPSSTVAAAAPAPAVADESIAPPAVPLPPSRDPSAPNAPTKLAQAKPAPLSSSKEIAEKATTDSSASGIQYAAPAAPAASSASLPAAVANSPRVMATPAPAARTLIASPDKLFQAIEAKDAAALRQALTQGASPKANTRHTPEGHPALQQAVIQRWTEGVRILLAAGADRNAKNNKGHTAADVALELGYSDMAELLATSK